MLEWIILIPLAVGHTGIAILLINVLHGLGIREGGPISLAKWSVVVAWAGMAAAMLAAVAGRPIGQWPPAAWPYTALCLAVALVGLPASTLVRSLRRPPPEASGTVRSIDLAATIPRRALIGTGRDALWLRLPGNQAFRPDLADWDVAFPGLPPSWDGLRILHLSDLHLTRAYADRFFLEIADRVADVEADLILFTGDLIDDESKLDLVVPMFERLDARLGKFAILGNHDYRFRIEGPIHALRSAGFTMLEGAWTLVEADGARFALGGTSAPWGPLPDPGTIPEADFRLLLSHTPDVISRAGRWGVDLMLSGHTHGGQYRLPVIGPVLLPSIYSRRFDSGFFRRGRTLLYVSRGIAAQHPLRINCPPEITRLTLRVAAAGPRPAANRGHRGLLRDQDRIGSIGRP